jgi:hypothetical protein
MLDPDPTVIHNWLQNPHITEEDVMRLASRRPARDLIQRKIYHSRWGSRYRIRLALAHNPHTPTELSVKLVGLLLRADLREIANDTALHETVRSEARRLLEPS